ncbi:MAG: SpoIID/LytB domain-containing protein, partial [Nitrospira defluvii]|nr:SpoIID/LytB domain-containing protein [Nitrospira defluvii]
MMAGSLLFFLAYAHPVSAESIRVLVAQEVTLLEVSSDGALAIVTEAGETKILRSPTHISSRGDGLHVDSRRVVGGQVVIRPLRNNLSLMMTQAGGAGAGARSGSLGQGGVAIAQGPALSVSGVVRVLRKGHTLSVVNQVDLEEYVKGVVPSEVSSAWHPEMLKVQAVAARTYALYNKMLSAAREYDVMSTIQDQVYRGRSGVDHRVEEAVESTRGIVVTHLKAPIYAAFSSTAAGPT